MKSAESCEVSSEVVSLLIDGEALEVLTGAATESRDVAAAVITRFDDTES